MGEKIKSWDEGITLESGVYLPGPILKVHDMTQK
jgi:hypothetical protein